MDNQTGDFLTVGGPFTSRSDLSELMRIVRNDRAGALYDASASA